MNEVKVSGRVLNCYIHDSGALVTKLACPHDHNVGGKVIRCESVFNTIMTDPKKIEQSDVMKGDKVLITGHLKVDFTKTSGGNERQTLRVYADEIEVTKQKEGLGIPTFSRLAYEV